jgi:hypothetical protein
MSRTAWLLLTSVMAFLAALGGVAVGRAMWPGASAPADGALHRLIHDRLTLDPAQMVRIERLEARYAVRRKALEAEMRADNARLAQAIRAEHGYGPQVAEAVNASHRAMGALQRETLAHVFAMRQQLRPEQTAAFDAAVADTLTDHGR